MADGHIFPTTRRMSTRVNAGAAGTAPARTGAGRARNAAGGASRERSDGSRTPRDRPGQRPPSRTEATERRAGRDAPGRQPRRGAHGASGRSRAPVAGRAKRGPPGRQPGRARAQAARCRRVTGLGGAMEPLWSVRRPAERQRSGRSARNSGGAGVGTGQRRRDGCVSKRRDGSGRYTLLVVRSRPLSQNHPHVYTTDKLLQAVTMCYSPRQLNLHCCSILTHREGVRMKYTFRYAAILLLLVTVGACANASTCTTAAMEEISSDNSLTSLQKQHRLDNLCLGKTVSAVGEVRNVTQRGIDLSPLHGDFTTSYGTGHSFRLADSHECGELLKIKKGDILHLKGTITDVYGSIQALSLSDSVCLPNR